MNEWPDAPQLRDALERLAEEADVATPARHRTTELLEQDRTPPVVELRPRPLDRTELAGRRWRAVGVMVAAVVLLGGAAIGYLQLIERGQDRVASVSDTATSAPTPTTSSPGGIVERLDRSQYCTEPLDEPTPFLLEAGERSLEVGAVGGGRLTLGMFVITSADGWVDTASRTSGLRDPESTTFYVPAAFGTEEAGSIADALLSASCGPANYLLSTAAGYPAAEAIACAAVPGTGFQGYGFVDPSAPPATCQLNHPTAVLSSSATFERSPWEEHMQCVGPTTREDEQGNEITTYESCARTFIHVETAATDPLDATIDGVAAEEFLAQIASLPA